MIEIVLRDSSSNMYVTCDDGDAVRPASIPLNCNFEGSLHLDGNNFSVDMSSYSVLLEILLCLEVVRILPEAACEEDAAEVSCRACHEDEAAVCLAAYCWFVEPFLFG